MEALRDDVLALILQHLDLKDLFACRVACKRLATVALRPDVWRHRRVRSDCGHYNRPWLRAALRQAPCVHEMKLKLGPGEDDCDGLLYDTRCAAVELSVVVRRGGDDHAWCTRAARAIRNQEALGQLRHLELRLPGVDGFFDAPVDLDDSDIDDADLEDEAALVRTALTVSGLESLKFSELSSPKVADSVLKGLGVRRMSALKRFACHLDGHCHLFREYILEKNAPTLEEVTVRCFEHEIRDGFSPIDLLIMRTGSLLAGMPKLRSLHCNLTIMDVRSLRCKPIVTRFVQKAGEFLLRSAQLRSVRLLISTPFNSLSGLELVVILSSTGEPQAEMLSVSQGLFTYLRDLASALPLLPNLQHLRLDTGIEVGMDELRKLLRTITPKNAPALQSIELGSLLKCHHHYMHEKSTLKLLSTNPSLHVKSGTPTTCRSVSDLGMCEFCAQGCHSEMWGGNRRLRVGLFMHPEGKCPYPDVHQPSQYLWVRL